MGEPGPVSSGAAAGAVPGKCAIVGSMCPMGGTSGGGDDGAVLPIGAGEIVLVDSAVGAAMLVSGAAMVVLVDSSAGADNGSSGAPGAEGDIGPLRADGRCKSVNTMGRCCWEGIGWGRYLWSIGALQCQCRPHHEIGIHVQGR